MKYPVKFKPNPPTLTPGPLLASQKEKLSPTVLDIKKCMFTNNSASNGGAIYTDVQTDKVCFA